MTESEQIAYNKGYNNGLVLGMASKGVLSGWDRIEDKRIRYIRDYLKGSTSNTDNHWIQIKAFDNLGNNVALGKTVTTSAAISTNEPQFATTPQRLTDGSIALTPYLLITSGGSIARYVTVDLGEAMDVSQIIVWHYYGGTRSYYDTKTEVSADGVHWMTVFDSAVSGIYQETVAGNIIDIV